jgi:hypothetical protein
MRANAASGRPDESVTKSPKMGPNPFFKINTQLLPWIKVAQNFGLLMYFIKKLPQRKQSPKRRKFVQSGHPDPSSISDMYMYILIQV